MGIFNWFSKLKKATPADDEPRVRILDTETGTVSTIPARELGPDMVRVNMKGVEGEVWVETATLKPSPHQHPPFDDELRAIMHRLADTLGEVYPITVEQWEDGFRRDKDAEREIAIWLHLAGVYARVTNGQPLTLAEKQDVFRLVLSCANNPREHVLKAAGIQSLSRPEAEAIMETFYTPDGREQG